MSLGLPQNAVKQEDGSIHFLEIQREEEDMPEDIKAALIEIKALRRENKLLKKRIA